MIDTPPDGPPVNDASEDPALTTDQPSAPTGASDGPVGGAAGEASLGRAIAAIGDYLGTWIEVQRQRKRVPGVQWAVGVRGEVLASGAHGFADAPGGVELTEEHLFRIASHSKWFAATLVMQLFQEGKLRLDDALAVHVPETEGTEAGTLTIRELLGHQAGVLRDGQDCNFWQLLRPFPDEAEILAMTTTGHEGLTYVANEFFKYSNVGLSLIGVVIERITGKPFTAALAERIAGPLGLTRTGGELDPGRTGEYARGHTKQLDQDDAVRVIPHVDTRAMAAATGCYSTASEMVRYGAAHAFGDERLLGDRAKRIMQRDESLVVVRNEEVGRYGLGVEVHRIGKRKLIGHSGGFPGYITRTFVDPKEGLVVCVLTNVLEGPAHELASGIVKLIDMAAELTGDPAEPGQTAQGDAAGVDPATFTGRFLNLWSYEDIVAVGKRLVMLWPAAEDPASMRADLTVIDADRLRIQREPGFGSSGETVRVHRDAGGRVVEIESGGMRAWAPERFRELRDALLDGHDRSAAAGHDAEGPGS